ncbi:polyribonucleotide nucleotidyltransferase [Candidatus Haliotispira prima]|uniref:Polyribonucleotide nucleotidyltransferase n=1 Tax=Candidatus Haliotispira prima TaxID=3034016 RepID=A0ABY8MF59_9SPIO|nr:polyribonucleotide nucleotidyltransferase [Candidatus Haliotispira prima]
MQALSLRIGAEELNFEVGKMARQANGSVLARYGGSVVLATVCCSSETRENLDFVPVSVDYNERYYAAGKIPGGFLKREARPKDKEILVSRLIDRPMRPLFHKSFGREIQVIPMTISTDMVNPPDILGMNAAFASVMISDIPFNGPVAAVRVVSINGEYVINPSFEQIEASEMEIVVAGGHNGICMVEGGAKEVSEEVMLSAIRTAESEIKRICDFMVELQQKCGKVKLPLPEGGKKDFPLAAEIRELVTPKLQKACFEATKEERSDGIGAARAEVLASISGKLEALAAEEPAVRDLANSVLHDVESEVVRSAILKKGLRCDGRKTDEIRQITTEIGTLPLTHGSALFTRGETQSLGVITLGSVSDEQIMDNIDGDRRASFMLHYNFPPYSVGETGRLATGRREIGHGHLAQRSLENVLPNKEDFPYTMRVVSEVLESNGSSSMATVCSGSMALMDAGVPIKSPVAGIAMGLITGGQGAESEYAVLSDILGEEDHLGDMDFKVAGTKDGITGFQMDIKISGISLEIMTKALDQAREGRMHILGIMNSTIDEARQQTSDTAPAVLSFKVEVDKIGAVIGPGGKFIRAIAEETGAKVDIANDGTVTIFCAQRSGALAAEARVKGMVSEPEANTVYNGTVKRIMDFGAFIEFLPGKEGLCHISKISKERVNSVADHLKEGQEVRVKLLEVDRMGRYNLSITDAL